MASIAAKECRYRLQRWPPNAISSSAFRDETAESIELHLAADIPKVRGEFSCGKNGTVLSVDDDITAHEAMLFTFFRFSYERVRPDLLSAYSASKMKPMLERHCGGSTRLPDLSLESGEVSPLVLRVLHLMCDQLGKRPVRIGLRAGADGQVIGSEARLFDTQSLNHFTSYALACVASGLTAHAGGRGNDELSRIRRESEFTIVAIAETRSEETHNHVKRDDRYAMELALENGMSLGETEIVNSASQLRDIGMLGDADAVRNKNGAYTEEQVAFMRRHSEYGCAMPRRCETAVLCAGATDALSRHRNAVAPTIPRGYRERHIHYEDELPH